MGLKTALIMPRSMAFQVLAFLGGALLGSMVGEVLTGQPTLHPHSLLATADDMSASNIAQNCPQWEIGAATQKQIQRDYCLRHFTGEPPTKELIKTRLMGPRGAPVEFMVYKKGDVVSDAIQSTYSWEPHLSAMLISALIHVADKHGLSYDQVHLLDIGGNVGVHTVFAQAAGFSVVSFEPLPQNEAIIRTNLCLNDPNQERVTLFTKGLGAEHTLCRQYSAIDWNQGNGIVNCKDPVAQLMDGHVYRGQMEIVRLDDVLLPCKGGRALPPGMVFGAMKMDVEGFESSVLMGGEQFLRAARIPFIIFEIGRMSAEQRKSVLKLFYDIGYQASTRGFFEGLGQPEDLPGIEDVHLTLNAEEDAS